MSAKPPAPALDPPAPPGHAPGIPVVFTKPAGAPEVKPAAPESAPKTTFDVDLYNPTEKDSYETISLEFYNDKRFAQALKAYNKNQQLQGGHYVNVPPIHVLKRQFPTQTGGTVVPVGGSRPGGAPATDTPDWSAPGGAPPARATYTVPRNGMTLQQIARQTMGTEQRWRDIYDLNPVITSPNNSLPAGTELKMPADARLP